MLQEIAEDGFDLDVGALLHVAVHGRGELGVFGRVVLPDESEEGLREQGSRRLLATAAHSSRAWRMVCFAVGDCVDLADGAVSRQVTRPRVAMKTHLCHMACDDAGGEFGVEAGVAHRLVEGLDARGDLSAELAVDELLHLVELDDASLIVEVGRDHADAAEDGVFAEWLERGFRCDACR